MKFHVLISEEYEKFINGKNVTLQQQKILDAKIKVLSEIGKNWNAVYELKGTLAEGLFRLEYSRFRIIFFFGNNNDIIICNAFIEKNKSDYAKYIHHAQKMRKEYYNET